MFLRRNHGTASFARKTGRRLLISAATLALIIAPLAFVSCTYQRFNLYKSQTPNELKMLVDRNPTHFQSPLTLLILVDHTPCSMALTETIWWRVWQTAALNAGLGFVFATSQADSADLDIAARLDSVEAPILVIPSCRDSLSGLGIPGGYLPLKLLVDTTGACQFWCSPVIDTAGRDYILHVLDSAAATVRASASFNFPNPTSPSLYATKIIN